VRRRGYDPEKARDVVQGYFAMLLEKRGLRVADPDRGRFRSFLLTSLKNHMTKEWERDRAQKRGAGREPIPLDPDTAEGRYQREPADHRTPDRIYDRRWAMVLLGRTMERLREEANRSERPDRFERLSRFLTGEDAGEPYKRVAADLGMSESAVRVAVHRMRARYGQLLRDEVAQTVDDPGRVDDEIRYLFDAMET
jgi:DNA-directed RNA polymerase specialized sigma24 family protein